MGRILLGALAQKKVTRAGSLPEKTDRAHPSWGKGVGPICFFWERTSAGS